MDDEQLEREPKDPHKLFKKLLQEPEEFLQRLHGFANKHVQHNLHLYIRRFCNNEEIENTYKVKITDCTRNNKRLKAAHQVVYHLSIHDTVGNFIVFVIHNGQYDSRYGSHGNAYANDEKDYDVLRHHAYRETHVRRWNNYRTRIALVGIRVNKEMCDLVPYPYHKRDKHKLRTMVLARHGYENNFITKKEFELQLKQERAPKKIRTRKSGRARMEAIILAGRGLKGLKQSRSYHKRSISNRLRRKTHRLAIQKRKTKK
jgi:hypothetical protein